MSRLRSTVSAVLHACVAALTLAVGTAIIHAEEPAPSPPGADEKKADDVAKGATEPADAEAVRAMAPEERMRRLDRVLAKVSKALSGTRTIRASFAQKKHLDVFDRDVVTSGTLAFQVPDRFRWATTEPLTMVLVVNGSKCLRRRTTRRGETVETAFELASDPVAATTVQQVFLWTTGDFEKARVGYEIELVSEAPIMIRATPTDENVRKVISSVVATFSGDPMHLVQITLNESSGGRTDIAFTDVERDGELDDALFSVELSR